MYIIDRGVVTIKPKQPYLNWVKNLPDPDTKITLEELRNDCDAFLVPENDSDPDGMKFIKANYGWLFESQLENWWRMEADWPATRDWKTFKEWFDIEFHSVVIDSADQPISRDEW